MSIKKLIHACTYTTGNHIYTHLKLTFKEYTSVIENGTILDLVIYTYIP